MKNSPILIDPLNLSEACMCIELKMAWSKILATYYFRRLTLVFILLNCFLISTAEAEDSPVVDIIRIEGNIHVAEMVVLAQVRSKAGSRVSNSDLAGDIKAIYRTGYFRKVSAYIRDESGKTALVFALVERPVISEISVEGNHEIENEEIIEKLNLKKGGLFEPRKIALGIKEINKLYESHGFYGTKISFSPSSMGEQKVKIVIEVEEGKKKVIREILFEGNQAFDSDTLRDEIETSNYKWWSSWITDSGLLDRETLEADISRLKRFYLSKGFVDVALSEPDILELDDGLKVLFKVNEGEKYNFGKIGVAGDLLPSGEIETLKGIKSVTGEVFNFTFLREDSFLITEKFTDIGFAFANIEPQTFIQRDKKVVDITFRISKGKKTFIDRIKVTGNSKTSENVVRRTLQIHEQELYSSSKIKRSQELLQRLGFFDEVAITSEKGKDEEKLNLNIAVKEGNTGSFSIGAGVSSGNGFLGTAKIRESNLFGSGNSLSLNLNSGTRNQNYVLSFRNPRLNDGYWSLGVSASSVQRNFDDFDRSQSGGSVSAGYPLWFLGKKYLDDIRFSMTYQFNSINIDNITDTAPQLVKDSTGKSESSGITPRIIRNTIDNPLSPTKGSRQILGFEFSGLGGNQRFWMVNASNSIFIPLLKTSFGNFVLAHRFHFDWGETYSGEKRFPLFRRLFPGGINSVRGFRARQLGPKDENGNEFGGNKQIVANFDLIFPLITKIGLQGVAFYDAGQGFDDGEPMRFDQLRHAVGWGVRWRSPIAPIRIEIGYPLGRKTGESAVVTHFSFGSPL